MKGTQQVRQGDLFDVLPEVPRDTFDACVTDPPYGLEFMGKEWDTPSAVARALRGETSGLPIGAGSGRGTSPTAGRPGFDLSLSSQRGMQVWHAAWAREVYRVLKPGAYLVAFGGTRTFHRLTCAIEDAGFEIRDCLMWLYGTGFPKSLNVSKAIVRAVGAADAAKQWVGWGTALKPGWEPIILARKPLQGTVADNVLTYGTGGINIDACRIPATEGRWPANVILDEDVAVQLNVQTGDLAVVGGPKTVDSGSTSMFGIGQAGRIYRDSGGAARFFYCAKASRKERDRGCDGLPERSGGEATDRVDGTDGLNSPRAGAGRTGGSRNIHPTVKPLSLMRYLVRLVTPPGGTVVDPFMGSGSTGMACRNEHVGFVGIEREAQYVDIAKRRLAHLDMEHPLTALEDL